MKYSWGCNNHNKNLNIILKKENSDKIICNVEGNNFSKNDGSFNNCKS